jgi:hypothetical protein
MELLRQTPFPLNILYSGLEPDESFLMEIYSNKSRLMYSFDDVQSDSSGEIEYALPEYFAKFDGKYALYIYSLDESNDPDQVVLQDTLSIHRPYVNPYTLGETEEEDEEAVYKERIARLIIDSITGGFYYTDDTIETAGLGGDFLAMPNRINRVNFVYRNNVKVYDRFAAEDVKQDVYVITPDHAAITIKKDGIYNRHQSLPKVLPLGASDSFNLYSDSNDPIAALTKIREFDLFPRDYDYVVTGEFGWPVVPQDIQDATRMLVDDISCNKLQYVSQYIKEYKTDQFTIKYDDLAVKGTGNMIVDKILAQHHNNFYKLGVL